jgi:hypothetical protein
VLLITLALGTSSVHECLANGSNLLLWSNVLGAGVQETFLDGVGSTGAGVGSTGAGVNRQEHVPDR